MLFSVFLLSSINKEQFEGLILLINFFNIKKKDDNIHQFTESFY